MKPGTDDFEALRRLLAWKRHEQPPPGYFSDFPRRVAARIESEQDNSSLPAWRAWLRSFDPRPVLVGAYTLGVSGLLLLGIGLSQALTENPLDAKMSHDPLASQGLAAALASAYPLPSPVIPGSATVLSTMNADLSSGPPAFLFDTPQLRAHPVFKPAQP